MFLEYFDNTGLDCVKIAYIYGAHSPKELVGSALNTKKKKKTQNQNTYQYSVHLSRFPISIFCEAFFSPMGQCGSLFLIPIFGLYVWTWLIFFGHIMHTLIYLKFCSDVSFLLIIYLPFFFSLEWASVRTTDTWHCSKGKSLNSSFSLFCFG